MAADYPVVGKEEQMDESAVVSYIKTFASVETSTAYGYTFFFYKSDHKLPFATLISSDQEYDRISHLDRPGVYRLNIGISKQTFQALFGTGKIDVDGYDFTALDVIMPHPEYAQQYFVCVLSPSESTFERVGALLAEAHAIAAQRYSRRRVDSGPLPEG